MRDPDISIIPKDGKDGYMILAMSEQGFLLQGELTRAQLEVLRDEIDFTLETNGDTVEA